MKRNPNAAAILPGLMAQPERCGAWAGGSSETAELHAILTITEQRERNAV